MIVTGERHFSYGSHLNARDRKAVNKTVSGLMKIVHAHGEATREEIGEILELAMEGRRRVGRNPMHRRQQRPPAPAGDAVSVVLSIASSAATLSSLGCSGRLSDIRSEN